MGFFTDLKEDLNQAVNELMPDETAAEKPRRGQENNQTLNQSVNLEEMLQNMSEFEVPGGNGETMPEGSAQKSAAMGITVEDPVWNTNAQGTEGLGEVQQSVETLQSSLDSMMQSESFTESNLESELRATFGASADEESAEDYLSSKPARANAEDYPASKPARSNAEDYLSSKPVQRNTEGIDKQWFLDFKNMDKTDEMAVITAGMKIKGDILSNGSVDVNGEVEGNIQIQGKLNITGKLNGNSRAEEIFAGSARITGDLISSGTVKIAAGTVVRGNIEATSAVVAGAVKGTIDVKGPVILDTTAVVLGNIQAKSMQINNGAQIEGMCVLCYAEQSAAKFFENQDNM